MECVKALNGGIAIQDRMAFQGEYFVDLYGKEAGVLVELALLFNKGVARGRTKKVMVLRL